MFLWKTKKVAFLSTIVLASFLSCLFPFLIYERYPKTSIAIRPTTLQQEERKHLWTIRQQEYQHPVPLTNATTITTERRPKKKRSRRLHKYLYTLSKEELKLEQLNAIEYYACCGLGHRLTKLADAWHLSRKFHLALKAYWGFCGNTNDTANNEEVYSYLFGSQPLDEVRHVLPDNVIIRLNNEVPGMENLYRNNEKNASECPCTLDKSLSDVDFYHSLQRRFRFRHLVRDFTEQHLFHNHTVIGVHVRGGNGETGDFVNKGRDLTMDTQKWVTNVVAPQIQDLLRESKNIGNPPLIYIASDTPTMVSYFQKAFSKSSPYNAISVIELPQLARKSHQKGVLFGSGSFTTNSSSSAQVCLQGWSQAVTDMMILSSADIVIAARPSSFVQSMPMSMALSGRQYCEIPLLISAGGKSSSSSMKCYSSYHEWCCGPSSNTKEMLGTIQNYEFVKVVQQHSNNNTPTLNWDQDVLNSAYFRSRPTNFLTMPMAESNNRRSELPFSWNNTRL